MAESLHGMKLLICKFNIDINILFLSIIVTGKEKILIELIDYNAISN